MLRAIDRSPSEEPPDVFDMRGDGGPVGASRGPSLTEPAYSGLRVAPFDEAERSRELVSMSAEQMAAFLGISTRTYEQVKDALNRIRYGMF